MKKPCLFPSYIFVSILLRLPPYFVYMFTIKRQHESEVFIYIVYSWTCVLHYRDCGRAMFTFDARKN